MTKEKAEKAIARHYAWALRSNLLKFEYETGHDETCWLTVSYHDTTTWEGKDWKWSLLCAQSLRDYKDSTELLNRINLMLAEQLRSRSQDAHGLLNDIREKRNI